MRIQSLEELLRLARIAKYGPGMPAHLPRVERVVPSTPEQCTCRSCGGETVVIGYEQSEQLDAKPAE